MPPEVTLLGIPPCQTPMCGVAYSCSYVLLLSLIVQVVRNVLATLDGMLNSPAVAGAGQNAAAR